MWCGCANAFGSPPNTHVCPVCLGMPGVLPVPNEEALRLTARCQFGRRASAPVLSLIEHFPDEVNAHLVRHECPRQICLR